MPGDGPSRYHPRLSSDDYRGKADLYRLTFTGSPSMEVLLQRRQLATSYRSSLNIGLSFTFGSIFSDVVNPRL